MQNSGTETKTPEQTRKRHGCLTLWLILTIAFSVTFIVLYSTGIGINAASRSSAGWAIPILVILLIFQVVCAVALFMWKKWGFWGICAINAIGLFVDILLGLSIIWPTAAVIISIAMLYGVLQLGRDNKGWPQLK